MGREKTYLALAIIGALLPVVLLGGFVADQGLGDAADAIFGNAAAAAVMADLSVSSLVFWVWLFREAPRVGVSPWGFVAGNVLLGLSFALPLFLYTRERHAAAATS